MPGKIKVKILAARNLPIMDRSAETTDAFCEVKLGTTTYKTDVYRKSLNPQWNSEWYRFEMDDAELQDEPLQIRVMDHDTYSANDAIGKLYLDLNPLLHLQCMHPTAKTIDAAAPPVVSSKPTGSVLSGWFPVYDTMHGIRGEVHVTVKVELFSDFNKFRESSCGVQFFSSSGIPYGHNALAIHGFVEELIKTSDPEYQWIEKIRTPRVTNEARQTTFFKLSGEVHRKIGLKVIDMGGNAVIGYLQCFDLEGESGIVARGIGTVVTLVKIPEPISTSVKDTSNEEDEFPLPRINIIPESPTRKDSPYIPPKKHHNGKKLYSRFPKKTNPFFLNSRLKLGKKHLRHTHEHKFPKKDTGSGDDSSSLSSFSQFDLRSQKPKKLINVISSSTLSLSKKLSGSKKELQDAADSRNETISFLVASLTKDPVFNFGHIYSSIEEESVENMSPDLSKMSSRSSETSESEIGTVSETSSIMTEISRSFYDGASDGIDAVSSNLSADDKSVLRSKNSSIDSAQLPNETLKPNNGLSVGIIELQNNAACKPSNSNFQISNIPDESLTGVEQVSLPSDAAQNKTSVVDKNSNTSLIQTLIDADSIFSKKVNLSSELSHQFEEATNEKLQPDRIIKEPESSNVKVASTCSLREPSTDALTYSDEDLNQPIPSTPCEAHRPDFESLNSQLQSSSRKTSCSGGLTWITSDDVSNYCENQVRLLDNASAQHSKPPIQVNVRRYSRREMEESFNVHHDPESPLHFSIDKGSFLEKSSEILVKSSLLKRDPELLHQDVRKKQDFFKETSRRSCRTQRSDTPPLSEMEPYELPMIKKSVNKETFYSSQSGIHHRTMTHRSRNSNPEEEFLYSLLNDTQTSRNANGFKSMPDLRLKGALKSKSESLKYQEFIDKTASCYKTESTRGLISSRLPEQTNLSKSFTSFQGSKNSHEFVSKYSTNDSAHNLLPMTSETIQQTETVNQKFDIEKSLNKANWINFTKTTNGSHENAKIVWKPPSISCDELSESSNQISDFNFSTEKNIKNLNPSNLSSSNLWGQKNIIHNFSAYYYSRNETPIPTSPVSDSRKPPVSSASLPLPKCKSECVITVSSSLNKIPGSVDPKMNFSGKARMENSLKHCSSTPLFSSHSKFVESSHNTFEFNALTLNNSDLTLNLAKNLLNSVIERQSDGKDTAESTATSLGSSKIYFEPDFCGGTSKIIQPENSNDFSSFEFSNSNNSLKSASKQSLSLGRTHSFCNSIRGVALEDNSFDPPLKIGLKFDSNNSLVESRKESEESFCNAILQTKSVSDFRQINDSNVCPSASKVINTSVSSLNPFDKFEVSLSTNSTLPPQTLLSTSSSNQGATKSGDGEGDPSSNQIVPQSLTPLVSKVLSQSPAKVVNAHRRSSDSELSVTPKGSSLTGSSGTGMNRTFLPNILLQPITDKKMFELHDYPFLTITRYPPGFIKRLGGTVSARSVKLLERSAVDEEPETRDTWWNELRLEVRSHARALACNVILGYSEQTAYNDDVCILSAIGTAATIHFHGNDSYHPENIINTKKKNEPKCQNIASSVENRRGVGDAITKRRLISENGDASDDLPCSLCHVPFKKSSMPFRVSLSKCLLCKRSFVPEILMTTIEPPEGIPILGEGCFLQAFIKRPKRDNRGELNAKEISDSAPFLEYELHRQLLNKLRVKGMNSIFSLKITISVGDRMITGHAAGTAVYLSALPILSLPTVTLGSNEKDVAKLEKIQKDLSDSVRKNRERFFLRPPSVSGPENEAITSDSEDSEVDLPEADFGTGNMDLCVLEVDDNEDVDLIPQLIESPPPRNLIVTAAEVLPGVDDLEAVRNLQMFTQVWRGRIPVTAPLSVFNRQFRTMLHKVYFKVRDMIPCALSGIRFLVDIPEPDELQITVFGMIIGLAPCEKLLNRYSKRKLFMKTSNSGESVKKFDENDLIFNLEEEAEDKKSSGASSQTALPQLAVPVVSKFSGGTPALHVRPKERYGIDITPLSFVPGGKIERYLGNMNLFFIREGTSIRENGGIGVFIHSFVTDVLAIMRAHVAALGGNAVVAYFMNQCILQNNPNKNQAQCLINVGGDAVLVNYRADD